MKYFKMLRNFCKSLLHVLLIHLKYTRLQKLKTRLVMLTCDTALMALILE